MRLGITNDGVWFRGRMSMRALVEALVDGNVDMDRLTEKVADERNRRDIERRAYEATINETNLATVTKMPIGQRRAWLKHNWHMKPGHTLIRVLGVSLVVVARMSEEDLQRRLEIGRQTARELYQNIQAWKHRGTFTLPPADQIIRRLRTVFDASWIYGLYERIAQEGGGLERDAEGIVTLLCVNLATFLTNGDDHPMKELAYSFVPRWIDALVDDDKMRADARAAFERYHKTVLGGIPLMPYLTVQQPPRSQG